MPFLIILKENSQTFFLEIIKNEIIKTKKKTKLKLGLHSYFIAIK